MSIKKRGRGRPRKNELLEAMPGPGRTLGEYNAFQDKLDRQLPPNTLKMHFYRRDRYDIARKAGMSHRDAIKQANEETAGRFNCTAQTVRNNIGTIRADGKYDGHGALWENQKMMDRLQQQTIFPRMRQLNEDVRRLNRAVEFLRGSAYADLRPQSLAFRSPEPTLRAPYNVWAFYRSEALEPDSVERLALTLAEAFLRAHKAAADATERARRAESRAEAAEKRIKSLRQAAVARKAVPGFG